MASREPLNQQSPLVELTQLVLSYIITKAETANFVVRNSKLLGLQIVVGDRTFAGRADEEEKVVEQFLRFLIEKEVTMSREDFNNVELDEEEQEDIGELAGKYAEGGLSEFGQQVQAARTERTTKLAAALRECDFSAPVTRIVDLLPELKAKTGLADLEVAEVMDCIGDVGLDSLLDGPADATEPVSGSDDKPN